jgi:hypothetical protein
MTKTQGPASDSLDTSTLEEALKRRRQKLGETKLGDAPDPLMAPVQGG